MEAKEARDDARSELKGKETCKEAQSPGAEDEAAVAPSEPKSIKEGFSINEMNMRDAETGELHWKSDKLGHILLEETELEARVPAAILKCKAVSREINFTSLSEIRNFRLVQRVLFHGTCIEGAIFF